MTDNKVEIVCPHCAAINRLPAVDTLVAAKCGTCHQPLLVGGPVNADGRTFDRFVKRNALPVVVDFWAEWCGPCRGMAPIYEKAAGRLEKQFRFLKVDTEAEPDLSVRYGIRTIPTLMLFQKGRILGQRAGAVDGRTLDSWLQSLRPL